MTDVYTDTEYSVTMLAVLAEHRGFVIRKMLLKFGTGGLKMTIEKCIEVLKGFRQEHEHFLNEKDNPFLEEIEAINTVFTAFEELKAYRKLRICGNCRHYVSGTTHFGECHVTSDIEPCVVSVNQAACDKFFGYKDLKMESKNNDT